MKTNKIKDGGKKSRGLTWKGNLINDNPNNLFEKLQKIRIGKLIKSWWYDN